MWLFKTFLLSAALAATAVTADISADSVEGKNLLSKARRVNQQYEEDFTWLTKHSIKFDSCHTIHTNGGEAGGGGGGGGRDEQGRTPFGVQHLVNFKLCPSSSGCSYCRGGGEYVVELREFVESYTQAKQQMQEAQCQTVEQNCNCQYYNGDDDTCMSQCYKDAGLSFCENNNNNNNQNNNNQFNVQEYMECREANFGNYYNKFYIGPVCSSSGKSIHLKLFTDASCTTLAPSGTYEKYNYNYALPYSKSSIIDSGCISCKEVDNNNNNQQQNNNQNAYYYEQPRVTEMCQQLYEGSAKCETNLKYKSSEYRDTGSCMYINKIIPSLEKVYRRSGGGGGGATFLAVFFFMTTLGATGAAYYFHTKVERSTVDLAAKDGEGAFA
jgi:hypothetical protein